MHIGQKVWSDKIAYKLKMHVGGWVGVLCCFAARASGFRLTNDLVQVQFVKALSLQV